MIRRALVVACVAACSAVPQVEPAKLGNGTVAVVGAVAIDGKLVGAVATRNGQTPQAALDALVFDAVLAQAATEQKLDLRPDVRSASRAVRARLVTDHILREVAGPPTDEEVARATAFHWRDVDAPESAHAVHVIVMADKDPEKQKRAHAVADALREAVLGATDEADFLERAKKVDARGLDVRPQSLPKFTADGRMLDADGNLDEAFAAATFALTPGETSPVVETKFGLHVIRLLERIPPVHLSLEERRARFADEIVAARAHQRWVALLADAKKTHPVVIDSAASALMASAIAP